MSTTTTGSYFIAPTDVLLPLDCDDGVRQSVEIGSQTFVFNLACNTDRVGGDLFGIVSYSLQDCFLACASYILRMGNDACTGVVFASDLKGWVSTGHANCFLKNSTSGATNHDGLVAAILVQ